MLCYFSLKIVSCHNWQTEENLKQYLKNVWFKKCGKKIKLRGMYGSGEQLCLHWFLFYLNFLMKMWYLFCYLRKMLIPISWENKMFIPLHQDRALMIWKQPFVFSWVFDIYSFTSRKLHLHSVSWEKGIFFCYFEKMVSLLSWENKIFIMLSSDKITNSLL